MPTMVLGLIVATALVILAAVLISPHRRRHSARDQGRDYAGDGGWHPAFVSGESGSSDCDPGDAGGGCDGGGGDGGGGGD
jgi:hypothetical protein